jgi:hypothetical protein
MALVAIAASTTSIAAIGNRMLECRVAPFGDFAQRRDHVAVLNVGGRDREVDQEALGVGAHVQLFAFDLLACVTF